MRAYTLERSYILILLCDNFPGMGTKGRYEDFYYICYCEQPPGFDKGATQLMFIYFNENILGNVVFDVRRMNLELQLVQIQIQGGGGGGANDEICSPLCKKGYSLVYAFSQPFRTRPPASCHMTGFSQTPGK